MTGLFYMGYVSDRMRPGRKRRFGYLALIGGRYDS